jgi:hypothetical protein
MLVNPYKRIDAWILYFDLKKTTISNYADGNQQFEVYWESIFQDLHCNRLAKSVIFELRIIINANNLKKWNPSRLSCLL